MKITIVFFILMFLLKQAFSQQDSLTATLSFKEAVKIGLQNNITLNQEENTLIATRTDKTSRWLQLGPIVSLNGNAGRNDGNSFNRQQGRVINGVLDFTNVSIDASMPLFNGLNVMHSARQSNSLYEAQLNRVNRSRQDVIRNVSGQYLTCLLDQQLVNINEKNLETQVKQYEQIRAQIEAGSRAEVDLFNQEYLVKNGELLVLRANNTLRNDKAALSQTLQLDPSISFELEEPAWQLTDLSLLSVEELYTIASERRSDLEQAKQTEKSAQYGYYALKGNYFPSVYAFASYGSAYNYIHRSEDIPDPQNRTFDQQFFTDNTQLTYGVTFRVPIYGAFQNRARVVRSKMVYENSKIQTSGLENTVKSEVLLAYQNLQDAQASFKVAESQAKAAELSYSLEKERYDLGITDIVSLTQASQAYTRAQGDYASAKYTLMFQNLLINYAVGTLKFEDIP